MRNTANIVRSSRPSALGLTALASIAQFTLHAQSFQYRYTYSPGTSSDFHGDKFGWSMATTDEWTVIGAPFANDFAGEVRVYTTDSFLNGDTSVPTLLTELIGPIAAQKFGAVLDCHGSTIAVGNCSVQGAVYCGNNATWVSIFAIVDGSWQQVQKVQRPGHATGHFGNAIALCEDWLAIGGARTGMDQEHCEKVYLYHRTGNGFNFQPDDSLAGLTYTGGDSDDFGSALDMDNDRLVVGARADDELGPDAGAAYLYTSNGGSPAYGYLSRKLLASDGAAGDVFGFSVALMDEHCAVGAPLKSIDGAHTGSAYIFSRDAGFNDNWGQVADMKPQPLEQQPDMQFGAAVALSSNHLAVGAPMDSLHSTYMHGSVALFADDGQGWVYQQTIKPWYDDAVNKLSRTGTSVAFAYESLLIGAPWAIVNGGTALPTGGVAVYADPVLGIAENATSVARVWPVPASDHVLIDLDLRAPDARRTIIRDALSHVLCDRVFVYGLGPVRLDLLSLDAGLYSIEVIAPQGSGGSVHCKIIRQ